MEQRLQEVREQEARREGGKGEERHLRLRQSAMRQRRAAMVLPPVLCVLLRSGVCRVRAGAWSTAGRCGAGRERACVRQAGG